MTYHAAALPPFLNDKSEVALVRKEATGDYLVAVPTARTDPADTVTVVQWRGDRAEEMASAVRYGKVPAKALRLLANKPASWQEYRQMKDRLRLSNAAVSQLTQLLPVEPRGDGGAVPGEPPQLKIADFGWSV